MIELMEQISEIDHDYVVATGREKKVLQSLRTLRKTFTNRGVVHPDLDELMKFKMDDLKTTIEEAKDAISRK